MFFLVFEQKQPSSFIFKDKCKKDDQSFKDVQKRLFYRGFFIPLGCVLFFILYVFLFYS